MKRSAWAGLCAGLGAIGLSAALAADAGAVSVDDFRVRTAQDLLDLCSVGPDDPHAVEAIHFCHGFASGAWNYYEAVHTGPEAEPNFVCLPEPPPTRAEAIAAFVAWAQTNPAYMKEAAVDVLFRYLAQKWPCLKQGDVPMGGGR
jgi:hypothetical protein